MVKVRGGWARGVVRCRAFAWVLVAVGLASCEVDPTDARFGGHPSVAGAALQMEDGTDLVAPFVLPPGGPHRLRVQYLDERGRPINSLGEEHRGGLIWRPGGRTLTQTVAEPLVFEVTFTQPCAAPTSLLIGYGHDQRVDERRFGPYRVQVERGHGGARLLRADSTELSPTVRLPAGEPTEVIVQILDCDGAVVEDLGGYETILFWEPADFASWTRLDSIGLRNEVTVSGAAGRRGFMSVGLRPQGASWHEAFGAFRVVAE